MEILYCLLIVVACSILNRVRGGGFYGDKLPGRALFFVAPVIGLLSLLLVPYTIAITITLGYLLWGVFSWGHTLSSIGNVVVNRPMTSLEKFLDKFPPSIGVFLRMLFVLPMTIAIGWLITNPLFFLAGIVFSVLSVIIYRILFNPIGNMDWMRAELAVGALWGILIVSIKFF